MTGGVLIDSHCHLDYLQRDGDLDAALARAAEAGVARMVTIGTTKAGFANLHAIAAAHEPVYCSVGIHPHEAGSDGQDKPDWLIAQALRPKVVGIGESGLDYYYDRSPRDRQLASFKTHIRAAQETGLPLIVHARDADEAIAECLREGHREAPFKGVLHCFSSGPELARAGLDLGLYISVSGIATFKTAQAIRKILAEVPLERLLIETDAPYLAPVPLRGKRNEPSFIGHTAAMLAELKGLSLKELAAATTANALALFHRIAPLAEA